MYIAIFLTLATIMAFGFHIYVRSFGIAVLLSAVTASAAYQAIAFMQEHHVDMFAELAFVFGLVYAAAISTVVGILVRRLRKGARL